MHGTFQPIEVLLVQAPVNQEPVGGATGAPLPQIDSLDGINALRAGKKAEKAAIGEFSE